MSSGVNACTVSLNSWYVDHRPQEYELSVEGPEFEDEEWIEEQADGGFAKGEPKESVRGLAPGQSIVGHRRNLGNELVTVFLE